MSITRKFLKGMGLTDEQQDTILEAHTETVNEIKAERDHLKSETESLPKLQKQLEQAQADLTAAQQDGWKEKYDALAGEFESYKGEQAQKEAHSAKEAAYRALLKEAGIWEKRIPTVMKVTDIDSLELNAKNELKGAEKLLEGVRADWADFIETTEVQGAETPFPPVNTIGSAMTKSEIMNIKDAGERQRAIAENPALFGI